MFLLVLIFICALALIILIHGRTPKGFPPGPPGVIFLGHVLIIARLLKVFKFHHLVWHHLSKNYGNLVGLRFVNDYVVLVSGKDLTRQLYFREELDGRPDGFFFRIRSFNQRLGIVFTDEELWEEQRRFSIKTLKSLGLGKTSMAKKLEREAEELMKNLASEHNKEIYIQKDDNNIFDISVINVLWTFLRGIRFDLGDEKVTALMKTIHKSFRIIDMSGGILCRLPWLRFFAPDKTGYRPLIKTLEPLWQFLEDNINEVLRSYDSQSDPKNFIEFYCQELSRKHDGRYFTKEQLLALCVDFFQAGSETTSNTLAFGILYMLHHPKIMKKVQEEIENVVGSRLPKLTDRPNLIYTEATICEIQRMANVAPVGIAHRALNDVQVGNFIIPKNAIVLFSTYSVHMDEIGHPIPFEFKPERFLDDNGKITTNDFFIPFGLGRRRCIGENLAKSSLFLFFASFVHCFDIEPTDIFPSLAGKDGITLSPETFKVKLIKRRDVIDTEN